MDLKAFEEKLRKKTDLTILKKEMEDLEYWRSKLQETLETNRDYQSLEAMLRRITGTMANRIRQVAREIQEIE